MYIFINEFVYKLQTYTFEWQSKSLYINDLKTV